MRKTPKIKKQKKSFKKKLKNLIQRVKKNQKMKQRKNKLKPQIIQKKQIKKNNFYLNKCYI